MKCYIKDYPRTQFVRSDWENLNGTWAFCFDDANCGEREKWYETFNRELMIQVPFTYETKLSGIQDERRHDYLWYHRSVQVDGAKLQHSNYILHFEGSDFLTKLWVNGKYAGSHKGGYARFSFDVTGLVHDGENDVVVKVEDSFDVHQPRGKQRWTDVSWAYIYVQTTGIWKTVWGEYAPKVRLEAVKMTPILSDESLELEVTVNTTDVRVLRRLLVEAEVSFRGRPVNRVTTRVLSGSAHTRIGLDEGISKGRRVSVAEWSPDSPSLYDITFRLFEEKNAGSETVECLDEVGSYFAMREIRIDGSRILLNGRPLYQKLVLDQGYWPESHLTPPSEEALIEDIEKTRKLGYNGLRKHQKIEDDRFLYWCDVKGLLVWSEMAATHQFSDDAVNEFTKEWMEIVRQNYNHPCIITWTPFNESWGIPWINTRKEQQHFTEAIYHLTKSFDPYRPVIVNDGWEHTVSDILTIHDYEASGDVFRDRYLDFFEELNSAGNEYNRIRMAMAEGYTYRGQPIVISEYGGIALDNDEHGWGYEGKVNSEEEFLSRFDKITTAIRELPQVCGYCYTQLTDVQQEMNGLMDMERRFKVNPEAVRRINSKRVGWKY